MTDEAQEDASVVLIEVRPGLWLGNQVAAENGPALGRAGITQTLNLAVNIDVPPLVQPDGTVVRRAKVGLIDGEGNTAAHLAAAVLAISGMAGQKAPGKPTYPDHRNGGILVHCRGGRSRSVIALALHLYLTDPAFPTLDDAIATLQRLRALPPRQPAQALRTLALETLDLLGAVRIVR